MEDFANISLNYSVQDLEAKHSECRHAIKKLLYKDYCVICDNINSKYEHVLPYLSVLLPGIKVVAI